MVIEEKDQVFSLTQDRTEMELIDNASERIKRIRKRFIEEMAYISIDRAKYYTENFEIKQRNCYYCKYLQQNHFVEDLLIKTKHNEFA